MPRGITPSMVWDLKTVSDPSLSPDGSTVAYTLSWMDRESLKSVSRICILDLRSGKAREFTQGTKDSAPQHSPDGRMLAFLRPDSRDKPQLWLMDTGGGEARQLTFTQAGVVEFAWSPDSRRLVFGTDVDPEAGKEGDASPRVSVIRRIRYRHDVLRWRGDAHSHLFVIEASGGTPRQITDGDWDDNSPVWSPDGSRIAFVSGRREDRDIHASTEAYVVPAKGGEPELWSGGLSMTGSLAWSPDGSRLAAIASHVPNGTAPWQSWIYILESRQEPRRLTDDSVRPVGVIYPYAGRGPEMRWDGDRILFLGDARGESYLCRVSATGGGLRKFAGGGAQFTLASFASAARSVVVAASSPDSPSDLLHISLPDGQVRRLSSYNDEYLAQHRPARMEKFAFRRNGMEIECRLFTPPDFDSSKKYPLVLDIHGGPNSVFYDSFVSVQQALAGAGYLVLAVNPRGSMSYGYDFMAAVLGDWGGEDYLDLMAAVDEMVKRPYVDANRLGVHGYSYGGYMSSWMIGHTQRFRAAVIGAPVTDMTSMYGTSDIGTSFGEFQWGGSYYEAYEKFVRHSPITYAPNVTTPALLLHGEADFRCPIAQSEQYFVALKRLGKEVEFVRFPGCSHGFVRLGQPRMREEYLQRMLAWFNRYLA